VPEIVKREAIKPGNQGSTQFVLVPVGSLSLESVLARFLGEGYSMELILLCVALDQDHLGLSDKVMGALDTRRGVKSPTNLVVTPR